MGTRLTQRILAKSFLIVFCLGLLFLISLQYFTSTGALSDVTKLKHGLRLEIFKNVSRINTEALCPSESKASPIAVIFVLSSPENSLRRQILRQTWAHKNEAAGLGIAFVVGETHDIQLKTRLNLESELFRDIIHTNFSDSYTALTQKTMASLKWFNDNCPNVQFAMKVDDDVFVNIHSLLDFLKMVSNYHDRRVEPTLPGQIEKEDESLKSIKAAEEENDYDDDSFAENNPHMFRLNIQKTQPLANDIHLSDETQHWNSPRDLKSVIRVQKTSSENETKRVSYKVINSIENLIASQSSRDLELTLYCLVWEEMPVIRKPKTKWSVLNDAFKDSVYPTYCSGVAYILPKRAAQLILDAHDKRSVNNDVFWIEDVYVTGILAKDAGLRHVDIGNRYAFESRNEERIKKGHTLFIHLGSDVEESLPLLWRLVPKPYQNDEM